MLTISAVRALFSDSSQINYFLAVLALIERYRAMEHIRVLIDS